jgi:DNA-binding IclR family transcriptional regulator
MNDARRTLGTLDKTVAVIEYLRDHDGARVTALADEMGVSKGTAHKHLSTLVHHGYVVQEGETYHLGLRFANLGEHALTRKPAYGRAREMATRLAARTDLESGFLVEENGRGVYLKTEVEDANAPHLEPKVGHREYLHVSAAGKAILAALPRRRIDAVVDRWGLPAVTEATITDYDDLLAELERVRDRGYAFNRGENKPGVRAVGTAVREGDGSVLGGVSLTVPEYRTADDDWFGDEVADRLVEATAAFEAEL